MVLKAIHDRLDEIPEPFRELFTEKDGKFELTGITGLKTQADVDRIEKALKKERDEHKAAKTKLQAWGELDPEDVHSKLDRIPELEVAAKGKLDEAKVEELVAKRVEGVLKGKTAPLERQLKTIEKEKADWLAERDGFVAADRSRKIADAVTKALLAAKVMPEAHEDALLLAGRVFEVRAEDGAVVARDGVGITPGIDPPAWLSEIQARKPHWWPPSQGGGAKGGGPGSLNGANPWSAEHWNVTEQARYARAHGEEKAAALAKVAGSRIGATRPTQPAKKA